MGATVGGGLDDNQDQFSGLVRGAIAGGAGGAAGGLVAGLSIMVGAVTIASGPVGWCVATRLYFCAVVGGAVGHISKTNPGRNGGAAGGAIGGLAALMTANSYNGRPFPAICARG